MHSNLIQQYLENNGYNYIVDGDKINIQIQNGYELENALEEIAKDVIKQLGFPKDSLFINMYLNHDLVKKDNKYYRTIYLQNPKIITPQFIPDITFMKVYDEYPHAYKLYEIYYKLLYNLDELEKDFPGIEIYDDRHNVFASKSITLEEFAQQHNLELKRDEFGIYDRTLPLCNDRLNVQIICCGGETCDPPIVSMPYRYVEYKNFIVFELPTFFQQNLRNTEEAHKFIENGQIIDYIVYRVGRNKDYYEFYYNLEDDTIHNTTNTIKRLYKGRGTTRPELLTDLVRQNQEEALRQRFGEKFRPPQPVGLSLQNIPDDLTTNYLYTYKIDGYNSYIIYGDNILQAEYYNNPNYTKHASKNDVYYVYDVIMDKPLEERLDWLKKNVAQNKYIKLKEFFPVDKSLQQLIKLGMDDVKTDGIIFSEKGQSYVNTKHYKLKPKEYLTNDYKYVYDKKLNGYYLYCTGNKFDYMNSLSPGYNKLDDKYSEFSFYVPYVVDNNKSYFISIKKSQVLMSDQILLKKFRTGQLHNKIVETGYDDNMCPYPQRIREDKLLPNGFNTCLVNFENRLNPIEDQPESYFQINNKDEKYQVFRDMGNDARKTYLEKALKLFTSGKKLNILDFGSGRGVNLHMIIPKVNIYYSLEPDRLAWVEQYRRIRDILKQQRIKKCPKIIIYDYTSNIKYQSIDLFISNYSIHYMLGNQQDINTVKQLLSNCNIAMYLYYSGQRIFNLLNENKGHYHNDKYEIVKKYKEDKLEEFGQKIDILIPTLSQDLYSEYLVNTDTLQKISGKELYNKQVYSAADIKKHGGDEYDQEYIQLIQCSIYENKISGGDRIGLQYYLFYFVKEHLEKNISLDDFVKKYQCQQYYDMLNRKVQLMGQDDYEYIYTEYPRQYINVYNHYQKKYPGYTTQQILQKCCDGEYSSGNKDIDEFIKYHAQLKLH